MTLTSTVLPRSWPPLTPAGSSCTGSHSRLIWAYSRFATHDGKSIVIARRERGELAELMAALELERRAR